MNLNINRFANTGGAVRNCERRNFAFLHCYMPSLPTDVCLCVCVRVEFR